MLQAAVYADSAAKISDPVLGIISDFDVCEALGFTDADRIIDEEIDSLQVALAASLARQDELARKLAIIQSVNSELNDDELPELKKQLSYEKAAKEILQSELQELLNSTSIPLSIVQRNEYLSNEFALCKAKESSNTEELVNTKNLSQKRAEELIEAAKQQEILNQQVSTLRAELGKLRELLAQLEQKDADSQIQLQNLGNRLNAALARAASEERKRRKAEEAERVRLEAEANKLKIERDDLANEASKLAKLNYDWKQKEEAYLARIQKLEGQITGLFVKPSFRSIYNKTVQEILKRKGCGVGVVDGKIGPVSISAAKAFAKVAGFKFSGSIYDEEFYERLTTINRKCSANVTTTNATNARHSDEWHAKYKFECSANRKNKANVTVDLNSPRNALGITITYTSGTFFTATISDVNDNQAIINFNGYKRKLILRRANNGKISAFTYGFGGSGACGGKI